jgi:hypothetical protein
MERVLVRLLLELVVVKKLFAVSCLLALLTHTFLFIYYISAHYSFQNHI